MVESENPTLNYPSVLYLGTYFPKGTLTLLKLEHKTCEKLEKVGNMLVGFKKEANKATSGAEDLLAKGVLIKYIQKAVSVDKSGKFARQSHGFVS